MLLQINSFRTTKWLSGLHMAMVSLGVVLVCYRLAYSPC